MELNMAATRKTETTDNPFTAFLNPQAFDFAAVVNTQKKAVEAVLEANRVAFEGYRKASEKHVANLQKTFDDASSAYTGILDAKTPDAHAEKQIALVKEFTSKGVDNLREVFDLTLSANQDAFSVFEKHFAETAKDVKTATKTAA